MKALFGKLLGRAHKTEAAPKNSRPLSDNPATIEDGSDNAMRRQLVLVLLRDVIRRRGIPPQWIELQMLVVNSASRGHGLYVRLVIKHWDARLLQYAQAFQNELLADIKRFEPLASEWLHGISWQLEMGDSCPYTSLPDKSFWLSPATPLPQAAPTPPPLAAHTLPSAVLSTAPSPTLRPQDQDSDAMEDLERLFLIRDQEIGQASSSVGYEKTQPSPLR